MKTKKGFTLIELIAVIVILGLVLIIAIPFFSGSLKTFRDDYYTNLNGNMLNAGKQFFDYNRLYLPHKYLDSAIVDANTLYEENIIDELKDYNGASCDKYESYVIAIRKSMDEVTYDTCLKCLDDNYDNFDEKEACSLAWKEGEGFSEVVFDKPEPVYIYKGTSRSELKKLVVTYPDIRRCLGKSGVCEKEIMRVSGKGESGVNPVYPVNLDTVNTNKLGTYNVKYKYESYGTYVDGKVIVYENNPPSIEITKTNKVKTGTITNSDVSKTSSYDKNPSNRNDWAQQLNFTFNYSFGSDAKPGLYVTKYQIFFNNRWEDYCTPAKGTNKCTKSELREMDETVKFRTVDSEGHISNFTDNIGLRIDRTKPSCQLRTDGTYGLRQWYITDVKISFQSKGDNYGTKPFPSANPVRSGESFSGVTLSQIKSNTYDYQKTDTNWITWYGYIEDKANNYEICNISFKRDATAPKCEFTIPAADGDDGWHKMPIVTVSFKTHTDTSGQPDYSGVEDYGFNTWNSGTKSINHIEDTAGVTYKGEIRDMAGNKSTCQISFKKDSTKPQCEATRPEPDGDNGWHKMPTVPVTIKSQSDNLSGVRNIGINTWNSGVKRVDHTADTNGITYTYQIRDIAGNMNTCSTWFKKDSTSPKCELVIPGADGENGWHRMPVVTVNFKTHTDTSGQPDYSGVRDYGINSWNSGIKTVNHTVNNANIQYTGQIRDNAGNMSTCSVGFKLDSTPPTCTAKVPPIDGDDGWHKMSTVKVEINTTYDNLSGVADYGINSWNSGTKIVNHTADTNGITYTYQIKDNAGNKNTCSVWFKKDSTAPKCEFTIPAADGDHGWHKMPVVSVSFKTHTDTSGQSNYSGVRDYGINSWNSGVKSDNYTGNSADVKYTGYIRDIAGNTSSCSVSFKKDSVAPTCTAKVPAIDGDDSWHKMSTVKVEINTTNDNLSGVEDYGINSWNSGTKVINHTDDTNGITYTYQLKDRAGNKNTCSVWFKKDSTAPKCEFTIPAADGENGWHKMSTVTVSFKTHTDTSGQSNYSGVRDYGLNSWNSGTKSVNHTSDSADIKYTGYIRDIAGNSSSCSVSFKKDSTAPTCTAKVPAIDGDDGWHKMSTVKVEINTTNDNLSGIMDYGINSWNSGTKVVNHTDDTNGITYTYQIKDNAGNTNTCSTWFKKDSTKPQCSITNTGTMGKNNWYTSSVTYSITGHSDNLSGVRDYGYNTTANGDKSRTHSSDTDGVTYTGYIKDIAGNINTCDTSFKKDGTAPSCAITLSGTTGDNGWYKGDVTYTISTHTDNLSGVKDYGYNSDASGDKSRTQTTDTDTVTRTGYIEDNAGNTNSCSTSYKMDKTAPSCSVTTSGTKGKNGWYRIGSVSGSFTSHTDNLSGVSTYGFGSYTGDHTTSTTTSTDGTTWTGYIKDKAGNTNSCTTSFKFDNIAPTCTSSGGSTWINKDVTIYGTCEDTGYSGCKENISKTYSKEINSSTETPGTVYDNAGNSVLCPQNRTVQIDKTKPTCSVSKSNTYSTDGVTTSVSRSDSGGSKINKSDSDSGETGVKSSKTYYVKDNAGNTGSCSVTVSSQGQTRSKSCSSGSRCKDAGCETWISCAHSDCGTHDCNCSDCHTGSNTCQGGYDTKSVAGDLSCTGADYTNSNWGGGWTCTTSAACAPTQGTYTCSKWNSCKTGSNTCKYGCDKCNNTCRTSACGCETYNSNIETCGCAEWGNFGSWSDSSSCSEGETSNHKTYYECRTLYY